MLSSISLLISEGLFLKHLSFFSRLIQDVQTYVARLGDTCAANVAVTR